jgi:hypothetical protein
MTFQNWPAISQGQQQGSARGDQREKIDAIFRSVFCEI